MIYTEFDLFSYFDFVYFIKDNKKSFYDELPITNLESCDRYMLSKLVILPPSYVYKNRTMIQYHRVNKNTIEKWISIYLEDSNESIYFIDSIMNTIEYKMYGIPECTIDILMRLTPKERNLLINSKNVLKHLSSNMQLAIKTYKYWNERTNQNRRIQKSFIYQDRQ